jgi:ribosomal-protein-alanine N-acetyltransferase
MSADLAAVSAAPAAVPAAVFVRPMRAEDVERAVAIASQLAEAPHWPSEVYSKALHSEASPRRLMLVAELEGVVVGFAVALVAVDEAELESIAVDAQAQRGGVGRLLLRRLTVLAQAEGVVRMLLEVRASNARALAFYQAQGWRQCGRRKRYYADPEEDAVLMERLLG